MRLQPCDEVIKQIRLAALGAGKHICARFDIDDRVMKMHRAAGLFGDWFGHKSGKAIMAQRRFAYQTLKIEYFICKPHRISMAEIDFQLTGATFLGDPVNLKPLSFCKIINIVDHWAEFIHRSHRIGLARRRRTPRTPHHGFDGFGRINIAGDQKKLHLRSDNRFPTLFSVKLDNPL